MVDIPAADPVHTAVNILAADLAHTAGIVPRAMADPMPPSRAMEAEVAATVAEVVTLLHRAVAPTAAEVVVDTIPVGAVATPEEAVAEVDTRAEVVAGTPEVIARTSDSAGVVVSSK